MCNVYPLTYRLTAVSPARASHSPVVEFIEDQHMSDRPRVCPRPS